MFAWVYAYILQPLGLAYPVQLHYQQSSSDDKTSLIETLLSQCPSLYGSKAWYSPSWWMFGSGNLQTAYSAMGDFTKVDRVEYDRKLLDVPDGGVIAIDITPPLAEAPVDDRPILVCMHGLTGGSHESYIRSVLSVLTAPREQGGHGWRGIVVTSRGCANAPLRTPKLYHCGATYDLKTSMLYIAHKFPNAPVYGIGFSLGAGMLTRYLGTEGGGSQMKAGIAVGAPWDLMIGHINLQASIMGMIYSKAMAKNLQRIFTKHINVFKQHPKIDISAVRDNPNMTLYEFDSLVTRVCGGFASTEEYYRTMSPRNFVNEIKVPFLGLNAIDDPIAASAALPYSSVEHNRNLAFATTKGGGHLGWFSGTFAFLTKRRWVVKPIVEFLLAVHAEGPAPKKNKAVKQAKEPELGDEMVVDPEDSDCGFKEVGQDSLLGGDDAGEESVLTQGL